MPELPQYITHSDKPEQLQTLINEALYILSRFGVPIEGLSKRCLERIAMAFLAVANVRTDTGWAKVDSSHALRTREIIRYWNNHFYENISESSYDDIAFLDLVRYIFKIQRLDLQNLGVPQLPGKRYIRRKDLKLTVLAGIIIASSANPNAARNDSTLR